MCYAISSYLKRFSMKLLITGGYGFLGSHTAELFYKEGHDIYIIDNLSSGKKENLANIKHTFYNLDASDKRCEEIFTNTSIDMVVHLASQYRDPDENNLYEIMESDVLGLINMLSLSQKYNVKKFIFASSSAIYGESSSDTFSVNEESICVPASLYGMNMLTKENYCNLYRDLYGLETIILRFSNIYGPRQTANRKNIIASIMNQIINKENVIIHENTSMLHDYIYVEDAAFAIYKAAQYTYSSLYNISSNNPINMNDLFGILNTSVTDIDSCLMQINDEPAAMYEPIISNNRAMKELHWSPIYKIQKGLSLTYKWYLNGKTAQSKEIIKQQNNTFDNKINYKKALPYLENILVFIIIFFLNRMLIDNQIEFPLDLKLVYILLFAIVYGLKHTYISILLSCILVLWQKYSAGNDFLSILYNVDTLLHITIYIFTGTVLSYVIEDKKTEIHNKTDEINELKKKFDFLYQLNNENKSIIKELQEQILQSEDSLVKIYQIVDSLKSLEPKEIFSASVNVIEKIMKSNDVLIYTVSKNGYYMRLIAYSAKGKLENVKKSIRIDDFPAMQNVIKSRKIYINREFNNELPLMMSPVFINDTVVSVIAINDMNFESLSLYKQNLFQVLTNLITSSFDRAYRYESAIAAEKYLDEMYVLKEKYFAQILQNIIISKDRNIMDYTLLRIWDDEWKNNNVVSKLNNNLREFDILGVNDKNQLFVILYNTNNEEAQFVIQRLKKNEIEVQLINGEEFYDNLSDYTFTA